jgi:hypothetical protein
MQPVYKPDADPVALLLLSSAGLVIVLRPRLCGGLPEKFRTGWPSAAGPALPALGSIMQGGRQACGPLAAEHRMHAEVACKVEPA